MAGSQPHLLQGYLTELRNGYSRLCVGKPLFRRCLEGKAQYQHLVCIHLLEPGVFQQKTGR